MCHGATRYQPRLRLALFEILGAKISRTKVGSFARNKDVLCAILRRWPSTLPSDLFCLVPAAAVASRAAVSRGDGDAAVNTGLTVVVKVKPPGVVAGGRFHQVFTKAAHLIAQGDKTCGTNSLHTGTKTGRVAGQASVYTGKMVLYRYCTADTVCVKSRIDG